MKTDQIVQDVSVKARSPIMEATAITLPCRCTADILQAPREPFSWRYLAEEADFRSEREVQVDQGSDIGREGAFHLVGVFGEYPMSSERNRYIDGTGGIPAHHEWLRYGHDPRQLLPKERRERRPCTETRLWPAIHLERRRRRAILTGICRQGQGNPSHPQ